MIGSGRYGKVHIFSYNNKSFAGKIIHKKLLPGHPNPSADQIIEVLIKFQNASALFDINHCCNIELFHSVVQLTPNSPPVLLNELLHENLNSYIARVRGNLSFNKQLNLCHDMANGLQFLHNLNLIHSNLHGANILISKDGQAKIADYICPQIDSLNENTASQNTAYMSPESIANRKVISQQSDIYSLGVIFLQVATQDPPLPDDSIEVSEVQRWKKQIDQIVENPLQSLIIQCFTKSVARPHIEYVCDKVATAKESPQSVDSDTLHNFEVIHINVLV